MISEYVAIAAAIAIATEKSKRCMFRRSYGKQTAPVCYKSPRIKSTLYTPVSASFGQSSDFPGFRDIASFESGTLDAVNFGGSIRKASGNR